MPSFVPAAADALSGSRLPTTAPGRMVLAGSASASVAAFFATVTAEIRAVGDYLVPWRSVPEDDGGAEAAAFARQSLEMLDRIGEMTAELQSLPLARSARGVPG